MGSKIRKLFQLVSMVLSRDAPSQGSNDTSSISCHEKGPIEKEHKLNLQCKRNSYNYFASTKKNHSNKTRCLLSRVSTSPLLATCERVSSRGQGFLELQRSLTRFVVISLVG